MATVCRQGTSFRLRGGSKRLYNNNDVIITTVFASISFAQRARVEVKPLMFM
jgi:hypothetical protein